MSKGTTTLHISLPESLKEYVKERVVEEHYSNPSDYIRALIRQDQKRRAEERLEQLLLAGLQSGPGKPMTPEEWQTLRKEAQARIKNKEQL
jgi:antitoxin ParD1/3/4